MDKGELAMKGYQIFHDESKGSANEEYWHAFFWVPADFVDELAGVLDQALGNSGFTGKDCSFKALGKKTSAYRYARYWLTIMRAALQNGKPNTREPFDLGRPLDQAVNKRVPDYRQFRSLPCCKLNILFFPNGLHDLNLCRDETARIETTFRIGLGGVAIFQVPIKPSTL